jgi:hypothetical protein
MRARAVPGAGRYELDAADLSAARRLKRWRAMRLMGDGSPGLPIPRAVGRHRPPAVPASDAEPVLNHMPTGGRCRRSVP